MSLSGGIFVPTDKNKKEIRIGSGGNKIQTFTIGESPSCDCNIENGGALYCELTIDNFGRVSERKNV